MYVGQWPIFCDFEGYLMDESHIWDNGSVWHKDWSHKGFKKHIYNDLLSYMYLQIILYLPPPCCVLEQDTLLPESTG